MKKLLGFLICMLFAVEAYASIAVSPTRIEINANKIKTNYMTTAIDIKGDSKTPTRFKAYTGYFTINDKSEIVQQEKNTDIYDISKKIRFVPSEFTVTQGKSQKLRINIAGLKQLPDGENRAILYLEDVNAKELNFNTGVDGIGAQLIIKSRIGIPLYVDKGKFTKCADVESMDVVKEKDGHYIVMKLVSTGNSRVRYETRIQLIKDKDLVDEYNLIGHVVGHNNTYVDKQKINTEKLKANEEYTLKAIVSYPDENGKRKNIVKETKLKIKGEL